MYIPRPNTIGATKPTQPTYQINIIIPKKIIIGVLIANAFMTAKEKIAVTSTLI